MEKRENFEIKKAPESLTAQDLEKVNGGAASSGGVCPKDDYRKK